MNDEKMPEINTASTVEELRVILSNVINSITMLGNSFGLRLAYLESLSGVTTEKLQKFFEDEKAASEDKAELK